MKQVRLLTLMWLCALVVPACILTPLPQTPILQSPEPTSTLMRQLIASPISTAAPTPTPEPSLAYNLLFLSPIDMNNYQLMYWDRTTGQAKILITNDEDDRFFGQTTGPTPSRIVHYSLTADHQELAVARVRSKPQGANGADEYELALLNRDNQQLKSLAKFESPVYWASISPDGKQLAYLAVENMLPDAPKWNDKFVIYTLKTDTPQQHFRIGSCEGYCAGLSWSPDGRMLAWNDEQGVWLASVNKSPAKLKAAGKMLVIADGKRGIHAPPSWSPDGRYFLVRSQEHKVGEWGIIDTQTGRYGQLPGSREYPHPNVHSVWLNDGRLFVVRSGDVATSLSPTGELWKVDPANKDLLILDHKFVIPVSAEAYPTEPTQFADGRLAFVLLSADEGHISETGLYAVAPSDYTPRKISEQLPVSFDVATVFASWLPDGSGALIHPGTGPICGIFVWADDFLPASVPQVMRGGTDCCFTWTK